MSGNFQASPGAQSYTNLTGAGSTQVKAGIGWLGGVTVNTGVASATVTVYDSLTATGTKIATISAAAPVSLPFGVRFSTGLFVVVTGAPDITISFS